MIAEKDWIKVRAGLEAAKTISLEQKIAVWEALGSPVPPPSVYKQAVVRDFGVQFGIKTLVETGTWHGDMVEASIKHFEKIYSIELSPKLAARASKKFVKYPQVSVLQGDSNQQLPAVLKALKEPAIFWLDAHYSAGDTAKGQLVTPIQSELGAVLGHPIKEHVILIDDARGFIGQNDYPSIADLKKQIYGEWPGASVVVQHDIIRITPAEQVV